MTFSLFAPTDTTCSAPPIFRSTKALLNGTRYYQSESYRSDQAASWRWIAAYGGDANNAPASTPCTDPNQVVHTGKPSVTFSATAGRSSKGRTVDSVRLSNGVAQPVPPGRSRPPSTGPTT